jgi:hypothetical protein
MADSKISELTALTGANVANDDEFAIVDTSGTETKRIIASEMSNFIGNNDIIMASGKGVDFSADSKGVFQGIESIVWRMVNSESAGGQNPLGGGGSDWEIADDTETEFYLGSVSSVTESSGIFSFGSTGYWKVVFYGRGLTTVTYDSAFEVEIDACSDFTTGPSWTTISNATQGLFASTAYASLSALAMLKITDTAEQKIKFLQLSGSGNSFFSGNGTLNRTYANFMKLADI